MRIRGRKGFGPRSWFSAPLAAPAAALVPGGQQELVTLTTSIPIATQDGDIIAAKV